MKSRFLAALAAIFLSLIMPAIAAQAGMPALVPSEGSVPLPLPKPQHLRQLLPEAPLPPPKPVLPQSAPEGSKRSWLLPSAEVLNFIPPSWNATLVQSKEPQPVNCTGQALASARAVSIYQFGGSKLGSGVLLNQQYILTAYHVVVGEGTRLKVKTILHNLVATVESFNTDADLALLRLSVPLYGVTPLPLEAKVPEWGEAYQMWSIQQANIPVRGNTFALLPPGKIEMEDATSGEIAVVEGATQYQISLGGVWGDSGSGIYSCHGSLAGILTAIVNLSLPDGQWDTIRKNKDAAEALKNRESLANSITRPEAIQSFLCGRSNPFRQELCRPTPP